MHQYRVLPGHDNQLSIQVIILKKKIIFSRVLHRSFYKDLTVYTEYIIYDIYVLIFLVPLEYSAVKLVYTVNMLL